MKLYPFKFAILFCLFLNPMFYSQSIGINLGSGYYYIYLSRMGNTGKIGNIPIKEVKLQYSHDIFNQMQISIMYGRGWNKYNYKEQFINNSNGQFYYSDEYEIKSTGSPVEIEISYHQYLNSDSLFEPIIGLGIGYCNYKSTFIERYSESTFRSEISTEGYSQYISIGLNMHITNKILTYIKLRKMLLNNLEISGDLNVILNGDGGTFKENYVSSTGLFDMGISLGLMFNL
ncbi:MAG: hypothetical protein WBV81_03615 [Ignavibacteriaceae bacterium]